MHPRDHVIYFFIGYLIVNFSISIKENNSMPKRDLALVFFTKTRKTKETKIATTKTIFSYKNSLNNSFFEHTKIIRKIISKGSNRKFTMLCNVVK